MNRKMQRSRTNNFKMINDNLNDRIRDDGFVYDREMMLAVYDPVMEALESVFDANGNFPLQYDPHRTYYDLATWQAMAPDRQHEHERTMEIHHFLFDDRGNLIPFLQKMLADLLKTKQWDWRCDAVRLYFANELGKKTSGSYPATYMWK